MRWMFRIEHWYTTYRVFRCMIAQGIGRGILWVLILSAAAYTTYLASERCPEGKTCAAPAQKR